jgi:hypothetical protein
MTKTVAGLLCASDGCANAARRIGTQKSKRAIAKKSGAEFRPDCERHFFRMHFVIKLMFRSQRTSGCMSVAHELSGLGSTRVVRFSASVRRRIDEPDSMATGPQDGEVLRCVEPMEGERTFRAGGGRDLGVLGAAVPSLPQALRGGGSHRSVRQTIGQGSVRRVPIDKVTWMLSEYRTRYTGWTVKHFYDHLRKQDNFRWSYTWVKTQLHTARLVIPARHRGAHRRKRPRKPCIGMMLHQDGSRHEWLDGQPELDLIATLDDATSELYSAFLVEEEGTASTFQGLLEVFTKHGLPSSLYTDRGSHYFLTPHAGERVDKERLTQVGRALSQLGIEHIPAYSPEARGRSERAFGTLQSRLVVLSQKIFRR